MLVCLNFKVNRIQQFKVRIGRNIVNSSLTLPLTTIYSLTLTTDYLTGKATTPTNICTQTKHNLASAQSEFESIFYLFAKYKEASNADVCSINSYEHTLDSFLPNTKCFANLKGFPNSFSQATSNLHGNVTTNLFAVNNNQITFRASKPRGHKGQTILHPPFSSS